MTDRLPSLPLLAQPSSQPYSPGSSSSSRLSSIGSAASSNAGSISSYTTFASSNSVPKTPTYTQPPSSVAYDAYPTYPAAMNQAAPDMYYQQPHMSAGQPQAPQPVSPAYHNPHQPPLLQPGPSYSAPSPYYSGYPNGLTSPSTAGPPVSASMNGPPAVLPLPGVSAQQGMGTQFPGFDTSGQVAPPGMKPRVTATLWEDEGSLCFQVEARGICVARREDNHMINGTKLLNVAGMTRGRRDGILKSEKVRHVVKIGPMHLKGVWIPFDRALEFANKEKITEQLYPLFVHNIGALLYHPANQTRTTQVMAAAERRKVEGTRVMPGQPTGALPSIGQHHHHSMMSGAPQPPLPSQSHMGPRPSMDRAQTFPTPPASASSVLGGGMGSDNFQWSQQGMGGAQATTPPGNSMPTMQQYPPASQPYDTSRSIYNPPVPQQSPYQPSNNSPQDRSMYSQSGYVKNDMAPPASRGAGPDGSDHKQNGYHAHNGEHVPHGAGEEEAEHEHDTEYTHDSGAYDASRASYNYNAPPVASVPSEHVNVAPEMAATNGHPVTSGRSTPRSAAAPQPYYAQGYNSPPRAPTSSNLFNVISNDRAPANGADVYASHADMGAMQNGYAAPIMNGTGGGVKRGRDDEAERPGSAGPGMGAYDMKRRKTVTEANLPSPVYDNNMNRPTSAIASRRR